MNLRDYNSVCAELHSSKMKRSRDLLLNIVLIVNSITVHI